MKMGFLAGLFFKEGWVGMERALVWYGMNCIVEFFLVGGCLIPGGWLGLCCA